MANTVQHPQGFELFVPPPQNIYKTATSNYFMHIIEIQSECGRNIAIKVGRMFKTI